MLRWHDNICDRMGSDLVTHEQQVVLRKMQMNVFQSFQAYSVTMGKFRNGGIGLTSKVVFLSWFK